MRPSETLAMHAPRTTAGRRGGYRTCSAVPEKNLQASAQQLTSRRSYFDAISFDIGKDSTPSSTRSTVTTKGLAPTNQGRVFGTTGPEKQEGQQNIIYIGIVIASGLVIIVVIIVVVVARKRHKRQRRSTSTQQQNEPDKYMSLNVRSGRGFVDGRGPEDGQEVETGAYQALNASAQRFNGTHPRIETARSTDDDQENLSLYYDDASSTRALDRQGTKNQGGTDEDQRTALYEISLYDNQQVSDLRQKRGGCPNISTETGESDYLELI